MTPRLSGIFISYRRSDNPDATGRIYDRLVAEFGKAQVFKDVDSIPLGMGFRGHLNASVGDCAVGLAIIGPGWAEAHVEQELSRSHGWKSDTTPVGNLHQLCLAGRDGKKRFYIDPAGMMMAVQITLIQNWNP